MFRKKTEDNEYRAINHTYSKNNNPTEDRQGCCLFFGFGMIVLFFNQTFYYFVIT